MPILLLKLKPTTICHEQKPWDTFAFLGHFPIHTCPTPPLPSPHKQHWTLVSRIFSEFQHCIVWGRGELQENFKRDLLFYGGIQNLQKIMNTALLSQGLLSMIVVVTKYVMYSPVVSIFEPQCKPVVLPVICVNS